MILEQSTFQDTVKGADRELDFSIDTDSSIIFEILRDKMYKDKIGTICREIASNSRDANRESKTDKPITITINKPNKLLSIQHPTIEFKDYGLGINPDKIADVYVRYGASDKRLTNSLTGGFGLGSKSPFAYTDTFTVITTCDYKGQRKKYTYTAMIDSSNKGKIVLFDEEPTDEETGTTVIIPIQEKDIEEFQEKVEYYTQTWENVEYKGFFVDKQEKVVETEDAIITLTEYDYGIKLMIDEIPYPLEYVRSIPKIPYPYILYLKFNTGELTISANRESVQYDEKTVKAIEKKIKKFNKNLEKIIKEEVDKQDTYYKACVEYCKIKYYTVGNDSFKKFISNYVYVNTINLPIEWKGKEIVRSVKFKHNEVIEVRLNGKTNEYAAFNFFDFEDKPVYILDTRKNSRRNQRLWDKGHESFYLIKTHNSKEATEELMNFIYSFDVDINLYSELTPIKKEKAKSEKKPYVTLRARVMRENHSHTIPFEIEVNRETYETDMISKKVVCKIVNSLSDYYNLDKLHFMKSRGYLPIVVRQQDYDNWLEEAGFINLEDKYEEELNNFINNEFEEKSKEYIKRRVFQIIRSHVGHYADLPALEAIQGILPESCKDIYDYKYLNVFEEEIINKKLKFDFNAVEQELNTIFNDKYSALTLLIKKRWEWSEEKRIKEIKKYINQVNYYENKSVNQ